MKQWLYLYDVNKAHVLKTNKMNLSTQDKYDGNSKVEELRENIGQDFYTHHSKTGAAKLVAVSEDGNTCRFIEVMSEFKSQQHLIASTEVKEMQSWLLWNFMCS